MTTRFDHCNLNVTDLAASVAFYERALGLTALRRHKAADGAYELAFLGDGQTGFLLELTWLRAHPQPYALGENESHICFRAPDIDAAHRLHDEMGCICYENPAMGLYFISDPDGYWLEIAPER